MTRLYLAALVVLLFFYFLSIQFIEANCGSHMLLKGSIGNSATVLSRGHHLQEKEYDVILLQDDGSEIKVFISEDLYRSLKLGDRVEIVMSKCGITLLKPN